MSDTLLPSDKNFSPSDLDVPPFPSLTVMRDTHRVLLRTFRAEGNTEEFAAAVLDFVIQGSATGVLLDDEDSRWAAQNMIDYWATMLYRWGYEGFDAELDEYDFDYAPELPDEICPYLGLNAFGEAQHDQFFGRERLIEEALTAIERHRFAAVTGLAGSGKSSLIMAGIIPDLKEGALPRSSAAQKETDDEEEEEANSSDWLYVPRVTPSAEPLKNLAEVLIKPDAAGQALAQQIRALRNDKRALLVALNQLVAANGQTETAVLFIDELEEIFTACDSEEERQQFIENVITVLDDKEAKHIIILAMHSDYEQNCEPWPALDAKLGQATIRITTPTTAELRDVILKPAQNIGLRFEEGLVDRLLQDVSGESIALPLLQFTLLRLWDYRDRNRITWDAYNHIGSGRGSLVTAVNSFYRNLDKEERALAKRLFLKFVIPQEESIELVRVTREELFQLVQDDRRMQKLLDGLLKVRLIRLTKGDTPAEDQFDLVHSALVQDWAQYVEWLEEARAEQYELLRLRTAAQQWRDAGRETSRLRRGDLLQASLRYLQEDLIGPLEYEFIQASLGEEERRRREQQEMEEREKELKDKLLDEQTKANSRLRTFVGVLAMAAVVAVLASILALTQRNFAVTAEATAVGALDEARLNEEEARSQAIIAQTRQAEAISAQATAEVAREEAQRQADIAATAEADARTNAAEARQQANIAATAEAEARTNAAEAREQANIARSGQLAAQAIGVRLEDNDLSLLLALQAIKTANTVEARSSLLNILQSVSQQISLVRRLSIDGLEERVFTASFNPEGTVIASAGYDNKIYFWDVETGAQIGQPLEQHDNWVRRVVFSPDGNLLASSSYDNNVILWDVSEITQPRLLREFNGHDDAVNAVVFIPTTNPTPGRFLATASRDRTIALWNISDPSNPLRVSTPQGGHTDKIYTMVVSPNGRTLISAGADQRILFWDISNPGRPSRPFRTLEGHSAEVNALAISNDGRVLASGDDSGVIILWDVSTGQRLGNLLGHSNWILELDFDPSGQYLASSSRDGNILLWNVADRERLSGPFSVHEDWVWDVEFNQDSTQLVSAGRDARIVFWDVKRTPQLSDVVAELPEQSVTAVSFPTADTVTIAYSGLVTTVSLDQQQEEAAPPSTDIDLDITEVQQANLILAADGQWAAAYEGRQLFLWDVQAGGSPIMLGEHTSTIQDIVFSGDGQRLATVSCAVDNTIAPPIEVEGTGEGETAAEAEADVTPFFLPEPICFQSEIRVWETAAPTTAAELLLVDEFELVTVALNQDGTLLAGGGCSRIESAPLDQQVAQDAGDKNICLAGSSVVWTLTDGAFTQSHTLLTDDESFAQLDFVRELAFSPDNRLLVSGSDDGTIIFWDAAAGKPLTTPLTAHNGQLNGMAFSPDGQVLATVGNDSLVALWDVATRQPLATELRNHESAVVSLGFSPDSRLLVTADLAGQVIVWRSNLETWRPLACEIAGRDLTEAEWAQYIGANIPQEAICEFPQ